VRAVGRPVYRMREDRLRALRALRFASRFDFTIDAATWEAIVASAPSLTQLSAERVKEELTKTMEQVDRPSRALALWKDSGALGVLVPTIAQIDAVGLATLDCLARPRGGVGPRAASRSSARRLARLAALFIGGTGAETARALKALRFSNADAEWIAHLVTVWADVVRDMEWALLAAPTVPDAVVRRWVATAGRTQVASLVRIAAARWNAVRSAGGPAPAAARVAAVYRRTIQSAYHDALALSDLAVDGDDLADAGIPRGPAIGDILRRLLAAVLVDQTLNVRDRLLALAREWAPDGPAGPA
jgi:tRNA nucleotidyltransferase (CCA-adding enzyme)